MAINYNVNPYYDDYDETKQFYRILFRPGRAVQARELTQLQTSLQKQIERFGRGIYKDGSIVVPGGLVVDRNLPYANLTSSFGSNTSDTLISSLIGETITGANSKVKAIVVKSEVSTTSGDPATIYLRYVSSSPYYNGTSFESNTVFQASETFTNTSGNITLQIANSSPTGIGTSFSVTNGVVFTKGVFAYFDDQKYIVEKYAQANNAILGFDVTESTVEATSDTSLLDPAVGASNYIAPGADRYKVALDLSKRPLVVTAVDDPNFIELVRIEDGEIISKNLDPQFSVLGDTLARRTYDESGDYTVRPYFIDIINHLKTAANTNDGYLIAADGGDDNKYVGFVSPGKSYVRGYEIENVRTRRIIGDKARDYANVNNGIVSSTIGNYIFVTNVNSFPDLSGDLPSAILYDRYTVTRSSTSGTAIGTAKIRGFEYYSGTSGSASAIYKLWLFDVTMTAGYVFEKDVKQIYVDNSGYVDFTADISPTLLQLTGSVTTSNVTGTGNTVTGIASRFTDEVRVNDIITVNDVKYRVTLIANSSSMNVTPTFSSNLSGTLAFVDTVSYNDTQYLAHIFEFPYSVIKSVDPTNLETSYDVKRSYSRTLSSNTVTITAGTDEVFAGISTTNYTLFVTNGAYAGNVVNPTSVITRGGSPTGKNITVDLSSLAVGAANVTAFSTATIIVVGTVQKTNSAADKKTKTLVTDATVDFTSNVTAQASTIPLGKADIYRVTSVSMSNAAFGSAYSATGATDITHRYSADNGQKPTYYDVGTINLKPGQSKPTGPIRVTFDYFTHGTGDYFSVDSYSGQVSYKDIPSFTHGNKVYQLRDCLDFRPRINDAGTGFSGAGAVINDFLAPGEDVQTDYSYYLPRTDKIVIDKDGLFTIVEGESSLAPKEPTTPDGSMALFVLKQNAYVFDVTKDINIISVDNKRFTMRDIGRIENRVKNLEYYTTLNLLERDTQSLQIQDGNGFDRFKNGFIVDNFSGHNLGDVYNRDYGVAIDYNKKELRPQSLVKNLELSEINTSTSERTANNYTLVNDLIMLPYTETEYISSRKASRTENINPFSVVTFKGKVTLDPAGDMWYEQGVLPVLQQNDEGLYDQFISTARSKGTYSSIWGNWRQLQYGDPRTEVRTGQFYNIVEQFDTVTNNDVVLNRFVIPKMRRIDIRFTGEGLRPNTRVNIFFDNFNVTNQCLLANNTSNTANSWVETFDKISANNLITDSTGRIDGIFAYDPYTLGLSVGIKQFRITDSRTNANNYTTIADGLFVADGQFTYDEYTRPRQPTGTSGGGVVDREVIQNGVPPQTLKPDIYDLISGVMLGSSTRSTRKGDNADDLLDAYQNLGSISAAAEGLSNQLVQRNNSGQIQTIGISNAGIATYAQFESVLNSQGNYSTSEVALYNEVRNSMSAEIWSSIDAGTPPTTGLAREYYDIYRAQDPTASFETIVERAITTSSVITTLGAVEFKDGSTYASPSTQSTISSGLNNTTINEQGSPVDVRPVYDGADVYVITPDYGGA